MLLSLRIQKGLLTSLHPKGGNLFSTFQGNSNHSSEWFPGEVTRIDNHQGPKTVQLMLPSTKSRCGQWWWLEREGTGSSTGRIVISHSTQSPKKAKQRIPPLLRIHSNAALYLTDFSSGQVGKPKWATHWCICSPNTFLFLCVNEPYFASFLSSEMLPTFC